MGEARRPSSLVRRRIPHSTTAVSRPQAVMPLARIPSQVHGISIMRRSNARVVKLNYCISGQEN